MNRKQLLQQAQEVIEAHPGFHLDARNDGIKLSGLYILDGIYEDVPYYDEFELKILISWNYPIDLPEVKETTGRVARTKYEHIYRDGRLCLGATCDLIDCVQSSHSLLEYLDKVISSYFFGFLYFEEYGVAPPFGERSHGYVGLKEAYKERYGVIDDIPLYNLLYTFGSGLPLRGHVLCPCGSGKRLRDCHGPMLQRDRDSVYFPQYRVEAAEIIQCACEEMEKQNEAKRRLRTAVQFGWKI